MADDPYLIPGTTVLKNLLGVSNGATLNQLEADLTRDRIQQLALLPPAGRFDLDHLKKIHAHIFQDVYAWAGEQRTISISKGGSMFCLPQHLEFAAGDIFGKLARENHLKGLSREAFADRAAYFFSEINALHPFREGNGRTQNLFLKQLGHGAGFEVSLEKVGREQMMVVARAAHLGDLDGARGLFLGHTVALPEQTATVVRTAGEPPAWLASLNALKQAYADTGIAAERANIIKEAKALAGEMASKLSPTQRTRLQILAVDAVQGSLSNMPEKVVAQATQTKSQGQDRGRR